MIPVYNLSYEKIKAKFHKFDVYLRLAYNAQKRGVPVEKRFYTVKEIAEDLGVKEDTVRDWVRRRELAAYRVGRELRIKKEDYEKFLAKRRIESQDE